MELMAGLDLAESIQMFILEHINENDFTDREVFNEFNYSSRHINRIFKQFTGKLLIPQK
ncbi:MAG: hypothetical protein ACLUFN_03625 [Eubacterium sp.]